MYGQKKSMLRKILFTDSPTEPFQPSFLRSDLSWMECESQPQQGLLLCPPSALFPIPFPRLGQVTCPTPSPDPLAPVSAVKVTVAFSVNSDRLLCLFSAKVCAGGDYGTYLLALSTVCNTWHLISPLHATA